MAQVSTLQSVQNIYNKMLATNDSMIGKNILASIITTSQEMDVLNAEGERVPAADGSGEVLRKRIFNTNYKSHIAVANDRNKALLREGYAAEKAGDTATAEAKYREYLNAITLSFNILSTKAGFSTVGKGDDIKGTLVRIDTKNGSLLSVEFKSIQAPIVGQGTKDDLFAMALAEDAPAQEETVEETVTA